MILRANLRCIRVHASISAQAPGRVLGSVQRIDQRHVDWSSQVSSIHLLLRQPRGGKTAAFTF